MIRSLNDLNLKTIIFSKAGSEGWFLFIFLLRLTEMIDKRMDAYNIQLFSSEKNLFDVNSKTFCIIKLK